MLKRVNGLKILLLLLVVEVVEDQTSHKQVEKMLLKLKKQKLLL
jgi:hypothetical protein